MLNDIQWLNYVNIAITYLNSGSDKQVFSRQGHCSTMIVFHYLKISVFPCVTHSVSCEALWAFPLFCWGCMKTGMSDESLDSRKLAQEIPTIRLLANQSQCWVLRTRSLTLRLTESGRTQAQWASWVRLSEPWGHVTFHNFTTRQLNFNYWRHNPVTVRAGLSWLTDPTDSVLWAQLHSSAMSCDSCQSWAGLLDSGSSWGSWSGASQWQTYAMNHCSHTNYAAVFEGLSTEHWQCNSMSN